MLPYPHVLRQEEDPLPHRLREPEPRRRGSGGCGMAIDDILQQLADGATLEGPHWTEPVKVLAVKVWGAKVEVQAEGLHTRRLWKKLLKADDFDGSVKITPCGKLAGLTGNSTQVRLAAEAHRIRLAFQYD